MSEVVSRTQTPFSIVLMLDFDGVLHPDGSVDEQCFVESTGLALGRMLRRHPLLEVVISSSWRARYEMDMLLRFLPRDISSKVVGCTPDRVDNIYLPEALWSIAREGQCWAWMQWNRPPGTPWIALDDDAWRFTPGCPNLYLVDGSTGLTETDVTQIENRLVALATPEQLQARFPTMFAGPHIGLGFARGWLPILERLCYQLHRELASESHRFRWTQIKEKFGTLRLHWELARKKPSPKSVSDTTAQRARARTRLVGRIRDLVERAKVESYVTCIICGKSAREYQDSSGWVHTLCEEHIAMHQAGEALPSAWFEPPGST